LSGMQMSDLLGKIQTIRDNSNHPEHPAPAGTPARPSGGTN
jgi:hypothetical protein